MRKNLVFLIILVAFYGCDLNQKSKLNMTLNKTNFIIDPLDHNSICQYSLISYNEKYSVSDVIIKYVIRNNNIIIKEDSFTLEPSIIVPNRGYPFKISYPYADNYKDYTIDISVSYGKETVIDPELGIELNNLDCKIDNFTSTYEVTGYIRNNTEKYLHNVKLISYIEWDTIMPSIIGFASGYINDIDISPNSISYFKIKGGIVKNMSIGPKHIFAIPTSE